MGIYFPNIKDKERCFFLCSDYEYSCILFLKRLGILLVGRNHGINVFSVKKRLVEFESSINVTGLVQSIAQVRASEVLIGLDTGELVWYDLHHKAKLNSWKLKETRILLLSLERCGSKRFIMASLSGVGEL